MTKEDIIRMAREAGLMVETSDGWDVWQPDNLESFAALVAAAEREACAVVVEQAGIDGYGTLAAALLVRERGAP